MESAAELAWNTHRPRQCRDGGDPQHAKAYAGGVGEPISAGRLAGRQDGGGAGGRSAVGGRDASCPSDFHKDQQSQRGGSGIAGAATRPLGLYCNAGGAMVTVEGRTLWHKPVSSVDVSSDVWRECGNWQDSSMVSR